MKLEFEMEIVSGDGFGPRVELSVIAGSQRRVIFADYPNEKYRGGIDAAAFSLVAQRLEVAMSELSLERS